MTRVLLDRMAAICNQSRPFWIASVRPCPGFEVELVCEGESDRAEERDDRERPDDDDCR